MIQDAVGDKLKRLITQYAQAYAQAYNEMDPHNPKHLKHGVLHGKHKVSTKSEEIKAEAMKSIVTYMGELCNRAESNTISMIYSIANDLADQDPKAIGSVSLSPYLSNAVTIYSEYLKGENYERINWRELDLPTLNKLQKDTIKDNE